jgi:hypothetical protein
VEQVANFGENVVHGQITTLKSQFKIVQALAHGDPTALNEAAASWISTELGTAVSAATLISKVTPKLTALMKLIPALRDLYMDDPAIEIINPDAAPGDPVYYVNGMFTPHDNAVASARLLSTKLKRSIGLLYNETHGDTDIAEACYDRTWLNLNAENLVPVPQLNSSARRLTALIYHTSKPISVITHSQGCLIMRNSIITAQAFREGVAEDVAWVAAGMPLRPEEVDPKPGKFTPLVDPRDTIATSVGLNVSAAFFQQALSYHDMNTIYIPMVSIGQLW